MKINLQLLILSIILILGIGTKSTAALGHGYSTGKKAAAAITDGFVTTWVTEGDDNAILIPINDRYLNEYQYTVDWGDNSTTNETGNATHTYSSSGTHTVTITGNFPAIQFNSAASDSKNDLKLRTVEKWGNGTWKGMDAAFRGCRNLVKVANASGPVFAPNSTLYCMFYDCKALNCDLNEWDLTSVREISYMFCNAISFNGDISDWNVSNVTNIQYLFYNAASFNGDISNWNVGKVEHMDHVFAYATAFNSDISNWDVGQAKNMSNMFDGASTFNQNINNWNVSNVTTMLSMFNEAEAFNQDLNQWDVSNVTNMNKMFEGDAAFNGDVSGWDVSNVTRMIGMFNGCKDFNQDLSQWDVSKVTNMSNMFEGDVVFNSDISGWDVSHVISMNRMFRNCGVFNQDLSQWNVHSAIDMSRMFNGAKSFDQDISSWSVQGVGNMEYMFFGAKSFNQNISSWQTQKVTLMDGMFYEATSFNQNIGNWNVSNVTSFDDVFHGASAFNQNLGNWDIRYVETMQHMLDGSGLSALNYESTLNGWAKMSRRPDVTLGAKGLYYCSNTGRQSLIDNDNWTIRQDRRYCLVTAVPDINGIVYVDSAVAAPGDGSSWGAALQYLSDATESAKMNADIKEIHIAKGTYYPSGDKNYPDRDSSFWVTRPGLKIMGGYSNGGDTRDIELNPTVLSGDIGTYADSSDNSINIMIILNIAKGSDVLILDGLTIQSGKGYNDSRSDEYGIAGGISINGAYYNTTISNCRFIGNYGSVASALSIVGPEESINQPDLIANPRILNCLFEDNEIIVDPDGDGSDPFGSTLINLAASPYIEHCVFNRNKGLLGGAVSNSNYSNPVFNSCTFTDNEAEAASVMYNYLGGNPVLVNCLIANNYNSGVENIEFDPELTEKFKNAVILNALFCSTSIINSTIAGNKAVDNPAPDDAPLIFSMYQSSVFITNSIVWGNKTNTVEDLEALTPYKIAYSLVQGVPADPDSHLQDGLTTQPVFIDADQGNFQLVSPSPLINAGLNDSLMLALAPYVSDLSDGGLDLAGHTRILDGTIDLGAYEEGSAPLPVNLQYFTGEWQNGPGLAALHWKSGVEEKGLDHYAIEKSSDGQDFHQVASKMATGSNSTYAYTTAQKEPTAYYRLKAVQSGGKFDFSPIVKVVRNGSGSGEGEGNGPLLYPNPAKNFINIRTGAETTLRIYSAAGSLVKSVNLKAGVNKIDISQLAAGVYFGKMNNEQLRFVKE